MVVLQWDHMRIVVVEVVVNDGHMGGSGESGGW